MAPFYQLKSSSKILPILLEFQVNLEPKFWFESRGFHMAYIPKGILDADPLFDKIFERFPEKKYNIKYVILKMNPYIFYQLHRDTLRKAAINMLLHGSNSFTFYGYPVKDSQNLVHIHELAYNPGRYYLLDTTEPHGIINRDQPRFVFSFGFDDPATYKTILDFLKENDL